MVAPVKLNFKVYQGSTFKEVLRWESSTRKYKTISNISKAAPAVITAVGHEIPAGWRFLVSNVTGMKEINSSEVYHIASSVTSDTITINALNSLSYTAYTAGGIVEYNAPVDLTGYTARMQIRSKVSATDVIIELTTENGGIVLDTVSNTITLTISATQTTELNFSSAVYSLEMVKAGEVTQLVMGTISLDKETTR